MKSDSAANDLPHAERATNGLLKKLLTGRGGYVLAISFALLFTAFAGYRAYSRYAEPSHTFDFSKTGMSDFHNGLYFPSKAFAQGINPYAKNVSDHFLVPRSTPVGMLIWRVRDRETNQESFGLTATITCLALLVAIYHHSYDGVLLLPIWLALMLGGRAVFGWLRSWERFALIGLLAVPVVNYVATLRFRELLQIGNHSAVWNAITSANGVCLVCALVLLLLVSLRKPVSV